MSDWSEVSRKVIQGVINAHPNASDAELRNAVKDAYPFGVRKFWPYKAWCKAVNDLLGPSVQKRRSAASHRAKHARESGQGELL